MSTETPTRREIIEAFIPNSPHAAELGIRLAEISSDEAVLELPFKPELATIASVVHGGAIGALIDTAAMAAAWATDEIPENPAGSTVALSVNFAAAADGVDLRASARVVKRGGRLSFCEVSVTDPDGAVVAHGIATYRFG
ncbi:MAG: PaaI family thioesterase [Solirubrobacterales bacterium]